MMKASYDQTADDLLIRLSDVPVARDVSYGWNVCVGYAADGQMVEITILDVSTLLEGDVEDDERTIILTERESRRLLEQLEHPPQPNEHLLNAMARYRETLRETDRRTAATDERASQETFERQTRQGRVDVDLRPEVDRREVQEWTANLPPAPPDGYASWLDYAIATMDTRSAEIESLLLDNPVSRAAMREAVRAELVALRRKAGEL